jgi:hypothetical protein
MFFQDTRLFCCCYYRWVEEEEEALMKTAVTDVNRARDLLCTNPGSVSKSSTEISYMFRRLGASPTDGMNVFRALMSGKCLFDLIPSHTQTQNEFDYNPRVALLLLSTPIPTCRVKLLLYSGCCLVPWRHPPSSAGAIRSIIAACWPVKEAESLSRSSLNGWRQ